MSQPYAAAGYRYYHGAIVCRATIDAAAAYVYTVYGRAAVCVCVRVCAYVRT